MTNATRELKARDADSKIASWHDFSSSAGPSQVPHSRIEGTIDEPFFNSIDPLQNVGIDCFAIHFVLRW